MSKCYQIIDTPIGNIGIHTKDNALIKINFLETGEVSATPSTPNAIIDQLNSYFSGKLAKFSIPYKLIGTQFQRTVWQALTNIHMGKTKTYGELATELNSSARAIGQACKHNPIPIVIPCHRIIAKTGNGGFAGQTKGRLVTIKQWLLDHEVSYNRTLC